MVLRTPVDNTYQVPGRIVGAVAQFMWFFSKVFLGEVLLIIILLLIIV